MGADQSTPRNGQRNSRNVSEAEVERALERQRQIYEQKMKEMLKNQKATQKSQQATPSPAPGPAALSNGYRVQLVPQAASFHTNIETAAEANCLERQRTPYSYNTNNLPAAPAVKTPTFSASLYPNLNDNGNSHLSPGNNNHNYRRSPVSSANNNGFVFVNSNLNANRFAPSAPPAPASPPRQRSVSRPRSGPENNIDCPTCKKLFGLKIFNCEQGHACCMDCRQRQRSCALCGSSITQRRNHSVEEYVADIKVPCLNEEEGCLLHFKLADMEGHVKECPFRETQCLLPGGLCLWKGKLSILATHFENFHPSHKGDVDTEMFLQLHNMCDSKRMQLIKIGNFNFVFHLQVSDAEKNIYIAVQLLGTKFSASKWSYEIHIYDKGAPRRKYQYTDKCFSNTEPLSELMKENKCAVIPLHYAKTFINNGAIAYKFYIKRDSDIRGESRRDVSCTRRGRGRGRGAYRKF